MADINSISFKDQKVLIRVDFNVPLNKAGRVTDDTRIRNSLPTIEKVIHEGGVAVLLTHLGRPEGKYQEEYSTKRIRLPLANLLKKPVLFFDACTGGELKKYVQNLAPGSVLLLENTRFYPEETSNDATFAQELASLANIYINDAFGTIHRQHASLNQLPRYVSKRAMGYLLKREIQALDQFLSGCPSETVALIGGNKLKDKLEALEHLTDHVAEVLIAGSLVLPYLSGKKGDNITHIDGKNGKTSIIIPQDVIALPKDLQTVQDNDIKTFLLKELPLNHNMIDIGIAAQTDFRKRILAAKNILWAGPIGCFESNQGMQGTLTITKAIAEATDNGAYSLAGGGNTSAAIQQLGYQDGFSYISTGGGALLAYMIHKKKLPNLVALA